MPLRRPSIRAASALGLAALMGVLAQAGLACGTESDRAYATDLALLDARLRGVMDARDEGLPEVVRHLAATATGDLLERLRPELQARGKAGLARAAERFVALGDGAPRDEAEDAYIAAKEPVFSELSSMRACLQLSALLDVMDAAARGPQAGAEGDAARIEVGAHILTAYALADDLAKDMDPTVKDVGLRAWDVIRPIQAEAPPAADPAVIRLAAAEIATAASVLN